MARSKPPTPPPAVSVTPLDWPQLTADERVTIRKAVRNQAKVGGQHPNHAAGICANLVAKSVKSRISLEHVVSALREMETQGIVASHIDGRGAEIWEVKR